MTGRQLIELIKISPNYTRAAILRMRNRIVKLIGGIYSLSRLHKSKVRKLSKQGVAGHIIAQKIFNEMLQLNKIHPEAIFLSGGIYGRTGVFFSYSWPGNPITIYYESREW